MNVLALASVDGWKITFPESDNTVVYAADLLLIGIFLNPTASVPSAVQEPKFPDAGVPKIGVTRVGLVANAFAPLPVEVVTPVPPFVTFNIGPASNNASMVSRSVLIFVPQVSVDAPTSGLVSNRFVVVVSAMFTSMRLFAKFRYYQQLQSKFHLNLKLQSMFLIGQILVSRSLNYQRSLSKFLPCRFRLPILILH